MKITFIAINFFYLFCTIYASENSNDVSRNSYAFIWTPILQKNILKMGESNVFTLSIKNISDSPIYIPCYLNSQGKTIGLKSNILYSYVSKPYSKFMLIADTKSSASFMRYVKSIRPTRLMSGQIFPLGEFKFNSVCPGKIKFLFYLSFLSNDGNDKHIYLPSDEMIRRYLKIFYLPSDTKILNANLKLCLFDYEVINKYTPELKKQIEECKQFLKSDDPKKNIHGLDILGKLLDKYYGEVAVCFLKSFDKYSKSIRRKVLGEIVFSKFHHLIEEEIFKIVTTDNFFTDDEMIMLSRRMLEVANKYSLSCLSYNYKFKEPYATQVRNIFSKYQKNKKSGK